MRHCKQFVLLIAAAVVGAPGLELAAKAQQPSSRRQTVNSAPALFAPVNEAGEEETVAYPAPLADDDPLDASTRNFVAPRGSRPRMQPVLQVAAEEDWDESLPPVVEGCQEGCLEGCNSCPRCAEQNLCSCSCNRWSIRADALWLQPSINSPTLGQVTSRTGAVTDTLAPGTLNFQTGARLHAVRQFDGRSQMEAIYYGFQQWSTSGSITADPAGAGTLVSSRFLQTSTLLGGLPGSINYQYGGNLYNFEVNQRTLIYARRWNTALLFGLRYLQWNDRLNLTGTDPALGATEAIDTRAYNYTIGPQLGLGTSRQWSRLRVNADFKSGLLCDFFMETRSNQNSTGLNGGLPVIGLVNSHERQARFAGVVDVFVNASYSLTKNVAVRGGYQVLFVPGLAMAPREIDGSHEDGTLFLHGPALGLEYNH